MAHARYVVGIDPRHMTVNTFKSSSLQRPSFKFVAVVMVTNMLQLESDKPSQPEYLDYVL